MTHLRTETDKLNHLALLENEETFYPQKIECFDSRVLREL